MSEGDEFDNAIKAVMKEKYKHLEMFAAAWMKATGLDPTKSVMIEKIEYTENGVTHTYYFEEKKAEVMR